MLQEGEFERLGGTRTQRVDVRIVTATNQDLAQMVKEKRFREDLFYRLNVITITVPPLRERREDIRLLAQHFLRVYAAKNNRTLEGFTDEAIRRLEGYAWPGNVRELENVIERGVVLARGALMDVTDLPEEIAGATPLPEGVLDGAHRHPARRDRAAPARRDLAGHRAATRPWPPSCSASTSARSPASSSAATSDETTARPREEVDS